MSLYRRKNRQVHVKVEATPGVDSAPTVSDAVLVEEPATEPDFEVLQTNEVGNSLDSRGPIVGGGPQTHSAVVLLRGAGAAGQAPDYDDYLRGCSMSVVLQAADITGTAQAGGTTTTIILAAGESAVTDVHKGKPIEITAGNNNGYKGVVMAYNGTTKAATVFPAASAAFDITSQYKLPANALYKPVSVGGERVSIYLYENAIDGTSQSLLSKLIGSAGTFQLALPTRPRPFQNAQAWLGQTAAAVAFKGREITVDWGGEVGQPDDPGALYGADVAAVINRRVTGKINPRKRLLSQQNIFADMAAGQARELWWAWGETYGNKISILLPAIVATANADEETDGWAVHGAPFESTGFDTGLYLCAY